MTSPDQNYSAEEQSVLNRAGVLCSSKFILFMFKQIETGPEDIGIRKSCNTHVLFNFFII